MRIKILLCLLLLGLVSCPSAKEYPRINFPLPGDILMDFVPGNNIYFSAIAPNVDPAQLLLTYNPPNGIITNYKNAVELSLKNNFALDEDAGVVIMANLIYYPVNGTLPVSASIKLGVDYRTGSLQKSDISHIYTFENAYKVDLVITSVDVYGNNVPQLKSKLKNFIEIVVSFEEERLRRINYATTATGLSACKDEVTDELVIKWNPNEIAEEYELEYTFVDDYSRTSAALSPSQISYNFKDNSTRVSTKENYYRIPLLFERGYILYRVRMIGRGGQNLDLPVYCIWTNITDKGIVSNFADRYRHNIPHMDDDINWQSATTFTEEGKRSDVIKYFDGTFRQRQEVTGINLEKQDLSYSGASLNSIQSQDCNLKGSRRNREVIASEYVYDFQGRMAVDIMTAPTNSMKIRYFPKLNISHTTQLPYNWKDFDKPALQCSAPNKLSSNLFNNVMGTSAYYSGNNPDQSGFNAFIPNAEQYPFTQITYLQDNTNRVSVQSGPGNDFKAGSGHETKFLYAAPNQRELDRMFGTEAGPYNRYQKNAVIDPNGQISITYLNPEGKTIATSLAGDSPGNVDELLNRSPHTINVPILTEVDAFDKTMIAEHQFIVVQENTIYNFNYSLVPEALSTNVCAQSYCLDCVYDIEISLSHIESCNNTPIFQYTGTIGELMNGSVIDFNCDNNGSTGLYPRQFSLTLDIGTYKVTKKITVNEEAARRYVEEIFKDTCRSEWESILEDELSRIDTMHCYSSCLECDDPPVQTASCNTDYCEPNPNRCDIIRGMMLGDVYPGAQHGKFDRNANGLVTANNYPGSVFYAGNIARRNNLIDILNNQIPSFQYQSLHSNPAINLQLNLTNLINDWRAEYAEYFLQLHPENCMLGWCNEPNITPSLDFDQKIIATEYYTDAVTKGYITSSSTYQQMLASDPLFPPGSTNYTTMLYMLEHLGCGNTAIPADRLAMNMAWCANNTLIPPLQPGESPQMNSPLVPSCDLPSNYMSMHTFGSDPALKDLEWTSLRAIYLSAKEDFLQGSMQGYASLNDCGECTNTGSIQCRFSSATALSLSAVNNSGVTSVNLNNIDVNDPCAVAESVNNQASSINQQFENYYCSSTSMVCHPSDSLPYLLTVLIIQAQHQPSVTINYGHWLTSTGATSVTASIVDQDKIRIIFNNCQTPLDIPFLQTNQGLIAPIGISGISNVNCSGSHYCSYSLAVNYPGNNHQILTFNTDCGIIICDPNSSSQTGNFCDPIPEMPEYPYTNNCVDELIASAWANASIRYNQWVDNMKDAVLEAYYNKCLSAVETFTMEYQDLQYHYTLYYYDQAGNLVKTIPPEGVRLLTSSADLQAVEYSRANNYSTQVLPRHIKYTLYKYNSLNEALWQYTPDAGTTNFYYDGLGRIVASQNAMQQHEGTFAYTKYDLLGRIEESGKVKTQSITHSFTRNFQLWRNFISMQPLRSEITLTKYDSPYLPSVNQKFGLSGQTNLRKRIASILKFEDVNRLINQHYSHATHYSYDIQGNVYKLIQDYPNTPVGDKVIQYDYDLHSGKVNKVTYQKGAVDQFIHKYSYDALNRLIRAKTSLDGYIWETDAEYFYYRHGSLARLELGTDKVQGLDYMYTLQGWIKGVNGTTLDPGKDMGLDGSNAPLTGVPQNVNVNGMQVNLYTNSQLFGNNFTGPGYSSLHSTTAKDAFGYVLDYFTGDYKPVNSGVGNAPLNALNQYTGSVRHLYNGNISRMYTQLQNLGNMGFNYTYDQLNRLKSQEGWRFSQSNMIPLSNQGYYMNLSYDADGNIAAMQRNGTEANPKMDMLEYHYYTKNGNTYIYNPNSPGPDDATNRLAYVKDGVSPNSYTIDIDEQNPGNYTYDAIGNLTGDAAEDINDIDWNLQNKIRKIYKTNYSLFFDYDALGNRVQKFKNSMDPVDNEHTFYVRDAQGNIMSIYSYKIKPGYGNNPQLFWDEAGIYGNSRLGLYKPEFPMENSLLLPYKKGTRGYKQYELTNHLGNVLATITDRKLPDTQTGVTTYAADISTSQDYYAFGMLMPGRNFNSNDFRFGFNSGSEKDNEIGGIGNYFTTFYREGNIRLASWWSIDPEANKQSWQSPYSYMDANPIQLNDPEGDWPDPGKKPLGQRLRHGIKVAFSKITGGTLPVETSRRIRSFNNIWYNIKTIVKDKDSAPKNLTNALSSKYFITFLNLKQKSIILFDAFEVKDKLIISDFNKHEDIENSLISGKRKVYLGPGNYKIKVIPNENGNTAYEIKLQTESAERITKQIYRLWGIIPFKIKKDSEEISIESMQTEKQFNLSKKIYFR